MGICEAVHCALTFCKMALKKLKNERGQCLSDGMAGKTCTEESASESSGALCRIHKVFLACANSKDTESHSIDSRLDSSSTAGNNQEKLSESAIRRMKRPLTRHLIARSTSLNTVALSALMICLNCLHVHRRASE